MGLVWRNLTIQTKKVALKSLKSMRLRLYKIKLLVIGDNTLEKRNKKLGKILNLAKAWGAS